MGVGTTRTVVEAALSACFFALGNVWAAPAAATPETSGLSSRPRLAVLVYGDSSLAPEDETRIRYAVRRHAISAAPAVEIVTDENVRVLRDARPELFGDCAVPDRPCNIKELGEIMDAQWFITVRVLRTGGGSRQLAFEFELQSASVRGHLRGSTFFQGTLEQLDHDNRLKSIFIELMKRIAGPLPPDEPADTGVLEIAARPESRVFVDNKEAGEPRRVDLAVGRHFVQVRAEGFSPYERWITIAKGKSCVLEIDFQARARNRTLGYASAGVSLASVAIAALGYQNAHEAQRALDAERPPIDTRLRRQRLDAVSRGNAMLIGGGIAAALGAGASVLFFSRSF